MTKKFPKFYSALVLLILLLTSNIGSAQLVPGSGEPQKDEVPEIPDDSLGRRTPRGTVSGFIKAVADQNYIRASHYLNLSRSQQKVKERQRIVQVAQKLLDQGGNIVPYSFISNQPEGRTDDELQPKIDLVGSVLIDGKAVELFVQNNEDDDDPPLWQFSTETVNALSAAKIGDAQLIDRLMPTALQEKIIGGVPLGHWFVLLVLIAFAYAVAWAIIFGISYLIHVLWKKSRLEPTHGVIKALELPFRLYLAVWIFVLSSQEVGISIVVRQRFSGITVIIGLVAFLLLLLRITDLVSNVSSRRMTSRGRLSTLSAILFIRRIVKVAIVVFGIIAILGTLGFDVTTGLAALGIGGIALALGAQKTVENFVGSVTLIADQPVRVGDFCKVGETTGTVEQIGMRSTRIRTQNRTIVTIPNGEFASKQIENYAPRDRFLFETTLDLRYETTPDQIRFLLVELRTILYSHPMVNPDPARVRFTGFAESSVKLSVYAYLDVPNYDEFLEVQEDLLLRMMDLVSESGADFAFPSQTLYLGRDKLGSEERVAEVEAKVAGWKESKSMQIPQFDPERINELRNTLEYPGEGSFKPKTEV